jgi:hypothetical protein
MHVMGKSCLCILCSSCVDLLSPFASFLLDWWLDSYCPVLQAGYVNVKLKGIRTRCECGGW